MATPPAARDGMAAQMAPLMFLAWREPLAAGDDAAQLSLAAPEASAAGGIRRYDDNR